MDDGILASLMPALQHLMTSKLADDMTYMKCFSYMLMKGKHFIWIILVEYKRLTETMSRGQSYNVNLSPAKLIYYDSFVNTAPGFQSRGFLILSHN